MILVWKLPCYHMNFCISFSPTCQSCIENLGCVTKYPRVEGMISKTGLSGWVFGGKKRLFKGCLLRLPVPMSAACSDPSCVQVCAVRDPSTDGRSAWKEGIPILQLCFSFLCPVFYCALPICICTQPHFVHASFASFLNVKEWCKNYPWG